MNELTPYQLIKSALDSIRSAASMVDWEHNRMAVSGIEKAAALLEAVGPMLSDVIIEESETDQESFVYKPEILDVETLLKPISENNPAGVNVRLSGEVNSLLSLVLNRARVADFKPQYSELMVRAKELLLARSKDLGVAVRLIEAATDESGFAAVADGLLLINGFFSSFWEGLYPECEDEDCEARANELIKMVELLLARLYAKYGQPHEFTPQSIDLDTARKEAMVFRVIMEQFDLLDKAIDRLFKEQAPNLSELRSLLRMFQARFDAQYETFRQNIKQEQDAANWEREQSLVAAIDSIDREIERQKTSSDDKNNIAAMSLDPEDLEDAVKRLDTCASFLVRNAPDDPLGYLVHRSRKWFSNISEKTSGNIPEERRRKIVDAFSSQQWEEVLLESEMAFTEGGHRWLDLQRYQVAAAQELGSGYSAIANIIIASSVDFVSVNRSILEDKMDDGVPCASPETVEWLRMQIANRGTQNTDWRLSNKSESFFVNEIERAKDLATKGKSGAGLGLLHLRLQQAGSRREQFLWRMALAEYCIGCGMIEIALANIDNLVEVVDKQNLVEWEDPELFVRVYKVGYRAYRSLGEKKAPMEKIHYFYRQICLYDPRQTISSEN